MNCSAQVVQWRDKRRGTHEADLEIRALRRETLRTGQILIVNSQIEAALGAVVDGIHLTSHHDAALAFRRGQRAGRSDLIIGQSVHSLDEALKSQDDGIHYLFLSPVQAPISKSSPMPPLGWRGFERIAGRLRVPVFALGGLSPGDEERAVECGAVGIAGIGWVAAERAAAQKPAQD